LALLTHQAVGALSAIHHRMPVVVPPDHYEDWLDCRRISSDTAVARLREPIADAWQLWPVDNAVNRGGIDGPGLLQPIEITAPEPPQPDPQLDLF
jgi:putative SOS response-associated peptidase YedK